MQPGTKVRVKSTASGSDLRFAGRKGIVIDFDPSLRWTGPRALLAPEMFVCVHFYPKSGLEKRRGSPLALLDHNNLSTLTDKT